MSQATSSSLHSKPSRRQGEKLLYNEGSRLGMPVFRLNNSQRNLPLLAPHQHFRTYNDCFSTVHIAIVWRCMLLLEGCLCCDRGGRVLLSVTSLLQAILCGGK